MKAGSKNGALHLSDKGDITAVEHNGKTVAFPLGYSLYQIDGEFADVEGVEPGETITVSLQSSTTKVNLSFASEELVRVSAAVADGERQCRLGITIPLPLSAVFHLPEGHNLGRRIDSDMPIGEHHVTKLGYNFLLADLGSCWLLIHARQTEGFQRFGRLAVEIERHRLVMMLTVGWGSEDDLYLNTYGSMEEALGYFTGWMERSLGMKKLVDRGLPQWVFNTKLVFIQDMMRSTGEIRHDYADIARMSDDLARIGCPADSVFYLPGWNGPYDSAYPSYEPIAELGGASGFDQMVERVHKNGFRILLHTNPWGVDPYHPEIDHYLPYVVKDTDGKYAGFQTKSRTKWGQVAPQWRILKFRTGAIPLAGVHRRKGDGLVFVTPQIPDRCEAQITIGGVKKGGQRIYIKVGPREIKTPPGWFQTNTDYTFPFALRLLEGENTTTVRIEGGDSDVLDGAWYRIHNCSFGVDPYATWTFPILFADTHDPEWIEIFTTAIAATVKKYRIDAIHCDATEYQHNKPVYDGLVKKLPDFPFFGEGYATFSAMGFWAFAQSGRCQSLTEYLDDRMLGTCFQGSLRDRSRLLEELAWLDKESPVTSFVKEYIKVYPHLCAAHAFVPHAKVCNVSEPTLAPRNRDELRKVLLDARRLDYIPALRLNYRQYGLDYDSEQAIRMIAEQATGGAA